MPKRPSLFEEHLLPQMKIHVNEKKMYNEEDMKIIYEKTKELLFKGANIKVNSGMQFIAPIPKTANSDCLRQTHLNNSCQIETHGENMDPVFEECKSCHATKMVNCQYCDSNLCFNCCAECESCKQIYCKNCTISGYVRNREIINCRWCSD